MGATYQFWLLDDYGRRLVLLQKPAYFSYSRSTSYFGTFEIGLPYDELKALVSPVFLPDRRISVYRSADEGIPPRHEGTFILRMPRIYTREDGVQMIVLYGHDAKDLLRRRWVIQAPDTQWTHKTDQIDDLMKAIVREQMLFGSCVDEDGVQDNTRAFPQNEFLVDGDMALGPSFTHAFPDSNVLDILKELHQASIQLHEASAANQRIYFDVISYEETNQNTPIAEIFKFVTYAGLMGQDRTASALVFAVENNNLKTPEYTRSHMDEENAIYVTGAGRGDSRDIVEVDDSDAINISRWNRCEGMIKVSSEPDPSSLGDYGYAELRKRGVQEEVNAIFLSVPGSADSPRSLYGIDWDLGDLLPVQYAGIQFELEVRIVFVSMGEDGVESITGRNDVNAGGQA